MVVHTRMEKVGSCCRSIYNVRPETELLDKVVESANQRRK